MSKKTIAVIFGAKSAEHEVSIVTAFQVWKWINPLKYNRYLVYLDKENNAYLCPELLRGDYKGFIAKVLEKNKRIEFVKNGFRAKRGFWGGRKVCLDTAILLMHGAFGEDGKIQGMLEFLDIPYSSCGVAASCLAMDKVLTKHLFKVLSLPTAPYYWFNYKDFLEGKDQIKRDLKEKIGYPLFIKPANGGSSVGISKVQKERVLTRAIKFASRYDKKILVEKSLEGAVDINCSVLGGKKFIVSPCEQPVTSKDFLTFDEKYLKGGKTKGMAGLARILPAPIPKQIEAKIRKMAVKIFKELGLWGVVRIDFLYQKRTGRVYVNEINTIPGSLAYYLWEAAGVKPGKLMDKLIKLALERKKEQKRISFDYQSAILDQK